MEYSKNYTLNGHNIITTTIIANDEMRCVVLFSRMTICFKEMQNISLKLYKAINQIFINIKIIII